MKLLILCPQWGLEHLTLEDFFEKVSSAGYNGIDTWVPENAIERNKFIRLLDEYRLSIVGHQHQATGRSIDEYCKSYEYYLNLTMECNPLLINSHSGRDYFSSDEQLRVIDIAEEFSIKNNITVAHETHRGRLGFSPYNASILFNCRPEMKITADFSHWTCVTESFLENCSEIVNEAVKRTKHIHARVGHTQGPQIPDPRSPYWEKELLFFTELWSSIIKNHTALKSEYLTITTEFGPPPYMPTNLNDNKPVADQWEINVFMKDWLLDKLA
jgi:sugar phosphate isomerase/epimerase